MEIPRRLRIGHGTRAALLALLIGGTVSSAEQGFRRDEVECEEAVAHLSDCCDVLSPRSIDCDFNAGCETSSYPSISPAESRCIRDLSCAEVLARGVCDRLLEREELLDDYTNAETGLCP